MPCYGRFASIFRRILIPYRLGKRRKRKPKPSLTSPLQPPASAPAESYPFQSARNSFDSAPPRKQPQFPPRSEYQTPSQPRASEPRAAPGACSKPKSHSALVRNSPTLEQFPSFHLAPNPAGL